MKRFRALQSRRRVAVGAALGVVVAVVVLAVAHGILGSSADERWWPAVIAAGFGGGVIGAILGVEASGELPDEGYDGVGDRRAESL
jgi:peptidoglycan/LPS O-acetylase OafA/YrhL